LSRVILEKGLSWRRGGDLEIERGEKKGRKKVLGGQSDKQKAGGITEWAGGLLISFVPKLLQDLTTKYGRDIAPLDKSLCKVQVEERTAT
jgi:hypothetical protein